MVYDEFEDIFREARADEVSRQERPDAFLPFDLCENCLWLERKEPGRGEEFRNHCIGMVKSLFPGTCESSRYSGPPISAVDLVPILARAFRAGRQ